jgi:hypothetical protein
VDTSPIRLLSHFTFSHIHPSRMQLNSVFMGLLSLVASSVAVPVAMYAGTKSMNGNSPVAGIVGAAYCKSSGR